MTIWTVFIIHCSMHPLTHPSALQGVSGLLTTHSLFSGPHAFLIFLGSSARKGTYQELGR